MAETEVAVARTPRGVLQHFTAHAATAPERAMGFNPTRDSEMHIFRRLQAQGVIREASPDLFYVDGKKLAAQRTEAATRVLGVGAAVGVLIAGFGVLRSRRRREGRREAERHPAVRRPR